jgi:hypothetical protein
MAAAVIAIAVLLEAALIGIVAFIAAWLYRITFRRR